MDHFFNLVRGVGIRDILDILIVAVVFYRLFLMLKETRGEQLMKGIIILFLFAKITGSDFVRFYTINWLLEELLNLGAIAIIIVFQPELRRALENLGRSNVWKQGFRSSGETAAERDVDEIVRACMSLSRQKIGALIVFEKKTGLGEIIETGTNIDASISMELLINIFIPNTPLHDGALIIRDGRILAAACILPLTENKELPRELGTRHRAAIGVTERSDAVSLIVSEETGAISVAERGKISRHLDESALRKELLEALRKDDLLFGNLRRNDDEKPQG